MYHPGLGRWVNMDPIGFTAGDVNLYRTVGNNPIIGLDPSGLEEIDKADTLDKALDKLGLDKTPANRGAVFEIITQLSLAKDGGLKANTGLGIGKASTATVELAIPKTLKEKEKAILEGAVGNAVPDLVGDVNFGKKLIAGASVLVDAKATKENITLSAGTVPYQPVKYIANLVQNAKLFGTQEGAGAVLDKATRLGGVLLFVTFADTKVSDEVASLAAANGVSVFRSVIDWDEKGCEFYVKKAVAVAAEKGVEFRGGTLTLEPGYVPFTQKGATIGKDAILKEFNRRKPK
jgi:hypothetical protein